ncbi:MAG: DsrE family protein [bacterium]|nr:DsrE family protein [bacterium]
MKVAIVIYANISDSDESESRLFNALEAALEFKNCGDEVKVIFDGGGTYSAAKIAQPDSVYHFLFRALRSHIAGVCSYCALSYEVRDPVLAAGMTLIDEFDRHPSFRKLLSEGYQVLTF